MNQSFWGLVLAGGGGKGSYQIGVWKALLDLGFDQKITAVSGDSVGALNAVLIGIGDYVQAENIWRRIKPSQFLDLEYNIDTDGDGKRGIFTREGLIEIMEHDLDLNLVKNSKKTLYANASRLVGKKLGAEYFHMNGKAPEEIKKILLASSALPRIYEPVNIGGNWYLDGGLTDNLPIFPLYQLGYRKIIVVGLGKELNIPRDQFPETEFISIYPSRSLGGFLNGTLDFSSAEVIPRMQLGYEDGKRVLEEYNKRII